MDQETVEKKDKGEDAAVKNWLKELDLSEKNEKDWTKASRDALKIYASQDFTNDTHEKRKETFNILWANVETKRPALYNSPPSAEVRRRFKDKNPLAMAVAKVLERAIDFTIDEGFDREIIAAVNDMLLPGRAITRVKYVPTLSDVDANAPEDAEREILYQEIQYEQWQWDKFRRGPGNVWREVPWIAFLHEFKKSTFEKRWSQFAEHVEFQTADQDKKEKLDNSDSSIFKTTRVWEIWDKEKREVLWISESYKEKPLEVVPDPLGLKHFYNIPNPLYAIENPVSLVPQCEYTMYETLAKELERITNRINRIINGIRVRGAYDATLSEIEKIFDEDDNGFVPIGDVSRAIEEGGLDKGIWMLPIRDMAEVLAHLYRRREGLISEIYEITGISDIQRGDTDPDETLGAQQLKANYGSQRLQRQQTAVQNYIRDLIKITGELIGEHFSQDMLAMMTGLSYPTDAEKQGAQLQLQAAAMSGQQPPPELQEVLNAPSWEQIMKVLQEDVLREFRIDIETDSTIQRQQNKDQEAITKLLTATMQFIEGAGPAVQSGFLSGDAAKKLLLSAVRRFDLGREVEEAIDSMETAAPPQQSDPLADIDKAKADAELEKLRIESVTSQEKHRLEMESLQREGAKSRLEHEVTMAELNARLTRATVEVAA